MTVRELLKDKEPTMQIKVGANGGSSFFYCGTVGEFMETIDEIDKALKPRAESAAEKLKKEFLRSLTGFTYTDNSKPKKDDSQDKTFSEWTEGKIAESVEGLKKAYNDWLGIAAQRQGEAIAAHQLVVEPVSVADREVITAFAASAVVEPEYTLCIMIHGFEMGEYWTMDERQIHG